MSSRLTQKKRICLIELTIATTLSLLLILGWYIRLPTALLLIPTLLSGVWIGLAAIHLTSIPLRFRLKEHSSPGTCYYIIEEKKILTGWEDMKEKDIFPFANKVFSKKEDGEACLEEIDKYYSHPITLFEAFCQW